MASNEKDNPRLLLVDDDPIYSSVLGQALGKRNYEVSIAHDLENGFRLAKKTQPQYAIIDLRIGHESGLEMVKKLKEFDDQIHIVVLTGFASIATAVEAIKLGATHYLTKPAVTEEIVDALNRKLGDETTSVKERPLSVRRLEWEHLQKVLMEHNGNISAAARALGMHRRTLQRKLDKRPVRE
ncbi:MAG: two-component system response regulator [Methylococcus sp.]|jgi:two-component system response regulator RegA|nr:MAG: two-component system response regulator [Methylococcus sp.]